MSNAESIAKEIAQVKHLHDQVDYYAEIIEDYGNDRVEEALQELKAKVDNKATEIESAIEDQKKENLPVPDWLKGQIYAYLNVLQLIDETINE